MNTNENKSLQGTQTLHAPECKTKLLSKGCIFGDVGCRWEGCDEDLSMENKDNGQGYFCFECGYEFCLSHLPVDHHNSVQEEQQRQQLQQVYEQYTPIQQYPNLWLPPVFVGPNYFPGTYHPHHATQGYTLPMRQTHTHVPVNHHQPSLQPKPQPAVTNIPPTFNETEFPPLPGTKGPQQPCDGTTKDAPK